MYDLSLPVPRLVLQAVQRHPLLMSPLLLEYLLSGEAIGRMQEKGLLDSPFHGVAAASPPGVIAGAIADALDAGWIARGGGFYPALNLTPQGEGRLLATAVRVVQ